MTIILAIMSYNYKISCWWNDKIAIQLTISTMQSCWKREENRETRHSSRADIILKYSGIEYQLQSSWYRTEDIFQLLISNSFCAAGVELEPGRALYQTILMMLLTWLGKDSKIFSISLTFPLIGWGVSHEAIKLKEVIFKWKQDKTLSKWRMAM